MREALRQSRRPQSRISGTQSIPSPVGGWNARDSLAAMPPTDAVVLENWFPGTSYCEMRGGTRTHIGEGQVVKTLAVYNSLSGASSMWALSSNGIYNATAAGGSFPALVLARTNGKHQWVNFGDGTNNYLILVNGVDKPAYYNGTAWVAVDGASAPALTGLTTTSIINVFVSKGRLYFIEKDSLSFWYLAAGAAGGLLTEFDLSAYAPRGGYLMAGATWTVDGGDGPDDRVVFITSEGDVIVYQGTNPSSAAAWSLVGTYFLGKPLGRRCLERYGGDLIALTQNGTFALSTAIQSASIDYKTALSYKIVNAFTEAASLYGANFGWETRLFPAQNALIVNIPVAEDGTHYQYVMNTITKAWCKFTGWNAEDFVVFNKELYFCGHGWNEYTSPSNNQLGIYKAWSGFVDGASAAYGNAIVAYGKAAFNYYGSMGLEKRYPMVRPIISANGPTTYLTGIDVDFQDTTITGSGGSITFTAGAWGSGIWGTSLWGGSYNIVKQWTSPPCPPGYCAALKLQVTSNSVGVRWLSYDMVFEKGGPL
jgi:hypothetical protein